MHEDEIPNLHIPVTLFIGRARRPTGNLGPVVVEDLRAGPAGPRLAHRPEIGFLTHAGTSSRVDADFLRPDARSLLILLVNRHPQPFFGDAQRPGHEVPCEVNRLALEVVAETEITQHLEKGVMAGRVADVFEVIVLAAGAYDALRARGARIFAHFLAEKHVLELNHAGIREQQRGVVAGHEGAGGHDGMPVLSEEFEKARPDFRTRHRLQSHIAFHKFYVTCLIDVGVNA